MIDQSVNNCSRSFHVFSWPHEPPQRSRAARPRGRRRVRDLRSEASGGGAAPRAAAAPARRVRRDGDVWRLAVPRPAANRLEYVLDLAYRSGRRSVEPDPANDLRAPGPFGDKSVIEFPGYEPPEWVSDEDSAPGSLTELPLESVRLRTTVPALLWSAADTDPQRPLPLLLVHDGPEYAHYSALVRLLDHLVDFGEVPELRAALLPPPGNRNEMYSASARYANALAADLVPACSSGADSDRPPVLLGASLGALAALHAHPQPGPVRRPRPPVGQLLPAALRRARVRLRRASRASRASSAHVHGRRGLAPRDPDGDHVRHGRGEPRQQPRARRRARARAAGTWRCDGHPTRTTGSRGATRSIRTSPSCCCERGREPPRPRGRAGAADRVRPLGPAAARVPVGARQALGLGGRGHDRRARPADRRRAASRSTASTARTRGAGAPTTCRWRSVRAATATTSGGSSSSVAPFVHDDGGGGEIIVTGASFGAYHAANFALKRADLFPLAICMSGVYDVSVVGWGERGDAVYFNNPIDYVGNLHGDHLDWLRVARRCCSCAARASGRTRPARSSRRRRSRRCSAPRASATSSTSGDTTFRTTGRRGRRRSLIICPALSDVASDRPAARHRGGLAAAPSRRSSRGSRRSRGPHASTRSGSSTSPSTCARSRATRS